MRSFLAYYNHMTQQLRHISDQPIYLTLLSDEYRLGARLVLEKDSENEHDDEAIIVNEQPGSVLDIDDDMVPDGGLCCPEPTPAYVANSTKTVARGTYSAGRIYDKFDRFLEVEVLFILRGASIVRVLGEPVN